MIARLEKIDWRAMITRRQPYGVLVLLCVYGAFAPRSALFVLALLHWLALDAIRTRKETPCASGLEAQVTSIEQKHRFCGVEIIVTNSQLYRVGTRHYLVQVSRAQQAAEEAA